MKKHLQNLSFLATRRQVAKLAKAAGVSVAAFTALVVSQGAQAAIDITAATTGITDASVAVLAVIAAMITMAVAVWGVKKVLKFFGR